MSFLQDFLKICSKTNLIESDAEEERRYRSPPNYSDLDYSRWYLLNFTSKYEWLPRSKRHRKKD